MDSSVQRRFSAFRVVVLNDQGIVSNPLAPFLELAQLPYDRREARVSAGCYRAVKMAERDQRFDAHGWISNLKTNDIPRARNRSERERLLDLDDDEGLDYPAHFIISDFSSWTKARPNAADFVAMMLFEGVHAAPGSAGLEQYLNRLFQGRWWVGLQPIINREPFERLSRMEDVSSLTVALAPAEQTTSLLGGYLPSTRIDNPRLTMTVKSHRGKIPVTTDMVNDLRQLSQANELKRLRVETERGQVLDLLADRLIFYESVIRLDARSRAPRRGDVFNALHNILDANRDALAELLGRSRPS